MNKGAVLAITFFAAACYTAVGSENSQNEAEQTGQALHATGGVPLPPWPADDERGMANTQSRATRLRCALNMAKANAKEYELSHLRSQTMPTSPFGAPLTYTFKPTAALPGTKHAFNGETISGEPAAQGTQMDALGHFAHFDNVWDGTGSPPLASAKYYNNFTQAQVKPSAASPLLKLGIEKVPPIVTSAVLLDARAFVGGGAPVPAGTLITAAHINGMLAAQGLATRGILPGDVLYIYTGWEDYWQDPDVTPFYYTKGPGLSQDATFLLRDKAVVLVALDNPFTDPVADGQLAGGPPPAGTPPGLPFVVHHQNLSISGVYQIQNAHLEEMAADHTWISCTIILPLREKGGSGSPVRPVAYGEPQN
jgi:kynurenine formamidase